MSGRIIILNGTSSAGKTTLARALRKTLDEPFCHYASDHLADAGFRPLRRGRSERDRFFSGFHRSIPALADAGLDLVVEHIVEAQAWWDELQQLLAGRDVFWVGVHAPIDVLEERERRRGDRATGEAAFHLKTHGFCRYDVEVLTDRPIEPVAATVAAAWRSRATC